MSINLEAFHEAVEAVSADIKKLRTDYDATERTTAVLQWMLAQIDSLTKRVAALENGVGQPRPQMDRFQDPEPLL